MDALTGVEYPSMRAEVLSAVEVLADPVHQRQVWVERKLPPGVFYDNLDLQVHLLFDDTIACADPAGAVPAILYEDEVEHFMALAEALEEVLNVPLLSTDKDFITSPRWPAVVSHARAALTAMTRNGDGLGSRNVPWSEEPE